ncbi:hypothetical protein Tco_0762224 [Tanacetum coccineum]
MLRKCHGHGLTKGAIIQIFYHGIDEPTQGILDVTAGVIFLYQSPNQAFQFLEEKVLFKLDWSTHSQNKHHQKFVAFADIKLKRGDAEMRNNYNNCGGNHTSKNNDTPMCERHEVNYIQFEELNNDVINDLEDFKRCICGMITVHWKLFAKDDGKTTGVLPNKESKIVNQEPQTDLEKSITKFLDGQRVTNMFFKNNVNDMIIKMKQNEKNFQTIFKNMERKTDKWSKSQNVSLEQYDRTDPPPPPQAHTEQVNAVFIGSGKSVDSPKIQKDPPPPIIVNNKIEKDRPIKTSKKGYHVVKTKEYPFRSWIPKRKQPDPATPILTAERINAVKKVNEQLLDEDIENLVEGEESDAKKFSDDMMLSQEDLDTRTDHGSHKESLKAKKVDEYVVIDEDEEEATTDAKLIRRKGKGSFEIRDTPLTTPTRSPRTVIDYLHSDKEKLQELTASKPTSSSSKPKTDRSKHIKGAIARMSRRYDYMFRHMKKSFMPRKYINTIAKTVEKTLKVVVPKMVNESTDQNMKDNLPMVVSDMCKIHISVYT